MKSGRWRSLDSLRWHWAVGVALAALIVPTGTCAAITGSVPALAHATLERSAPADGATIATSPRQVDLYFGQQLVQSHTGTFALVLGDAGATVSDEAKLDPQDGKHLLVPLHGTLDAGRYTVFWKTTSDDDGGVTLGSFSFSVGQPVAEPTVPGGQVLVPDDARTRTLTISTTSDGGNGRLIIGLATGAALGLALGAGAAVYLVRRRRTPQPAAIRPARGRRR